MEGPLVHDYLLNRCSKRVSWKESSITSIALDNTLSDVGTLVHDYLLPRWSKRVSWKKSSITSICMLICMLLSQHLS
ncbi:unnamed protein product [Cuscuta campestris]|uniref:Uncharacterized protein n=1 Tax=Cuscuta campestris TaxID=132261 RepID=A0A484MBW2_9ASTE|nr:unnamed protein product [Cuscuta campestris]VFQ86463.1 unnamed protein product [Cuscuta campestris]